MLIVLTYFWLGWVLLHIWLSFTIHYFLFNFKCYSILHFAVCQLLCWAFLCIFLTANITVYIICNFKSVYIFLIKKNCSKLADYHVKIVVWSIRKEPLLAFSGGMPRASYGDHHTLTVMHGNRHIVFDFTSKVIDFFLICTADEQKPHAKYGQPVCFFSRPLLLRTWLRYFWIKQLPL